MIRVPSNLSLVRIKPDTIRLTAYRFHPFSAPIHVNTTGELPGDCEFKGMSTSPVNIPVYATKGFIKRRSPLETEKIDLSQLSETRSFDTRILVPPEVRLRTNQSQWVKVTIFIDKKRV